MNPTSTKSPTTAVTVISLSKNPSKTESDRPYAMPKAPSKHAPTTGKSPGVNKNIRAQKSPSAIKTPRSPKLNNNSPVQEKIIDFRQKAVKAFRSASRSLLNRRKLKRDGRKTPEEYRQTVLAVSSPSQLSLKSITEYYSVPDSNFTNADDVFRYRGYKKLAKIDEGAFGVVSKALRRVDRYFVAVKEIDLRRKRNKRLEEMRRELFVLQRIEHKNVVKLIEHFIVNDTLVIIMEFCAGNNLTTYLKTSPIDESECVVLFRQMADSIKVLHRNGISHRDVKLNNFLLDSTRKIVKIGDFGLSIVTYRNRDGIHMAKTYCGTEPYMAPEIMTRNSLGLRCYNPIIADIWSLGICLFAMLTRSFPFKINASQQSLVKAQVNRRWKFPRTLRSTLSDELKDLVWHMLDPDPYRRITINGVVSHSWLNGNKVFKLSYDNLKAIKTSE